MYKSLIFLLPIILLAAPSLVIAKSNPLLGTWEYIKGEYATKDGLAKAQAPEVTSTRIISSTHFSYITQHNGKFSYAGGGTYKLEEGYFIETIQYGNLPHLLGKTMKFTYKIDGDIWHHMLYEKGKLVEREVWKRISL